MANASATVPSAELSPSNISDQVNRVLASNTFQNCATLQAFLRYITARALESDDASLSEQSIAIGVFGKDESFDSATDTIVRTQAYRLRQKLKEYYAGQGVNDPILIEVPRGHYRPIFNLRTAASPASPPLLDLAPVVLPATRRAGLSRLILICCAGVVVLLALAAGIVIGRKTAAHEPQNLRVAAPQGSVFWKWFLGDEKNPIVAYSNDLYLMTTRGDLLYYSGPGGDRGTVADPAIARESMLGESHAGPLFYEDDKSHVGEVVGAVALAETLTRLNIQPIFKRGRVITTYDLESHNIVFLGSPFVSKILNHVDAHADFVFEGARRSAATKSEMSNRKRGKHPLTGWSATRTPERS